jgi:hypothetical protein
MVAIFLLQTNNHQFCLYIFLKANQQEYYRNSYDIFSAAFAHCLVLESGYIYDIFKKNDFFSWKSKSLSHCDISDIKCEGYSSYFGPWKR